MAVLVPDDSLQVFLLLKFFIKQRIRAGKTRLLLSSTGKYSRQAVEGTEASPEPGVFKLDKNLEANKLKS